MINRRAFLSIAVAAAAAPAIPSVPMAPAPEARITLMLTPGGDEWVRMSARMLQKVVEGHAARGGGPAWFDDAVRLAR